MVVPVILNGTPAVITTCSVSSASPSANAARTALTTASLKRVLLPDRTQFVPQVKARRLAVPISDDKAMIGGLGKLDNQTFMFIGQQKGNNIKSRQYRNFGMANPEGYRKALRLMKLAEKFSIPIVALIDTPGAYPGIEAEEKGQAEAIARLWEGNSPREEAFKSVGLSKDRMQKLFRAQAASELECF